MSSRYLKDILGPGDGDLGIASESQMGQGAAQMMRIAAKPMRAALQGCWLW